MVQRFFVTMDVVGSKEATCEDVHQWLHRRLDWEEGGVRASIVWVHNPDLRSDLPGFAIPPPDRTFTMEPIQEKFNRIWQELSKQQGAPNAFSTEAALLTLAEVIQEQPK